LQRVARNPAIAAKFHIFNQDFLPGGWLLGNGWK
jgi:hypothetical protein